MKFEIVDDLRFIYKVEFIGFNYWLDGWGKGKRILDVWEIVGMLVLLN